MKTLMTMFLIVGWSAAAGQDTREGNVQDPKAQERINNLRIAYLTDKLGLTTEQAEKFWPVYREFSQERTKLRNELREKRSTIDPANPDPRAQQELIDLGLRLKQRELDLERDYSTRLLKVISAQQVLTLRSAEREFADMLRNQIQQRRLQQQRMENFRDRNQRLPQRRN